MQHPVPMDQKQTLAIQNFSPNFTFVAEFRMHLTASELEIPPDAKECNPGFAFSPSSRKSGERPGEEALLLFFVAEFRILRLEQPCVVHKVRRLYEMF